MAKKRVNAKNTGTLRIGDHWNAIRIIALSQSNPLKAIAEFVENSIDAKAENVYVVRGKQQGQQYLKVIDDGEGISDFHYVATHIGDSIKRKLKASGAAGIQGEFGIGLLSFWTVGEELSLQSVGADGRERRMRLVKDNPGFSVRESSTLVERRGTELRIQPLLPGIRTLAGEKIQAYLASELRDRITRSGVRIRIIDRSARKQFEVEPRKFHGRLLHQLPEIRHPAGDPYIELYLTEPSAGSQVSLYKQGTRVVADITTLEGFDHQPWSTGYLEGIIDAPFIQLTPGTRGGVILDDDYYSLVESLEPVEEALSALIEEQKRAEEEETSRSILRKVTRALREAFLMLPREEYGWLDTRSRTSVESREGPGGGGKGGSAIDAGAGSEETTEGIAAADERGGDGQRSFFEFPGPLYRLLVSPRSSTVRVGETTKLRAVARDRSKRPIDSGIEISWRVVEGGGELAPGEGEFVEYRAPEEPEVAVVEATARQGEVALEARATVTVVAELIHRRPGEETAFKNGLPGYTFRRAPGELWRSRYEAAQSLIVINNAHADFIFASRQEKTKLRYIARLYAKEIVLENFPGASPGELLERMVELTLYVEDNLR